MGYFHQLPCQPGPQRLQFRNWQLTTKKYELEGMLLINFPTKIHKIGIREAIMLACTESSVRLRGKQSIGGGDIILPTFR